MVTNALVACRRDGDEIACVVCCLLFVVSGWGDVEARQAATAPPRLSGLVRLRGELAAGMWGAALRAAPILNAE